MGKSAIEEIKDFYQKNKDKEDLVVVLKEKDIFTYIEEILQFNEHKAVKFVRDLDTWNIYYGRK